MQSPSLSASAMLGLGAWLTGALDASAQDQDVGAHGFAVLGVGLLPEYEGADETQIVPFAVADIDAFGLGFELFGLKGAVDVLPGETIWKAGPAFSVTTPRDELSLYGHLLEEQDLAIEAGAFVGFETPFGGLREGALSGEVAIRQDVSGAHDGLLVTPEVKYMFAVNRLFRVGAGLSATWASDDYMETYFNAPVAAGPDAPLYTAGAGFKNADAQVFSVLSFSERTGVFTRVSYSRLLGDAADSPIVTTDGKEDQMFYGVGAFFRF